MEEKERYYYEKILRDCVIPEGLFEIKDREGNFYLIIENKKDVDTITKLLNKQSKRIKELEQENKVGEFWHSGYQRKQLEYDIVYAELRKVMDENEQLKQQLEEHKKIQSFDNEEKIKMYLDTLTKPKIIELCLQFIYDKNCLKQQLHDLPNKIVEEITNELSNNTSLYFEIRESTSAHCPNKEYEWFNYVRFRNYINTILKKYGGEDDLR